MHFDLLDEFGTLVPFGLGISKGNRVVQHPDIVGAGGEADAESHERRPTSMWAKLAMMLHRVTHRDGIPFIDRHLLSRSHAFVAVTSTGEVRSELASAFSTVKPTPSSAALISSSAGKR